MPFAPQIRKQVLQALEESILPALRDKIITQIRVAPPFDVAPAEFWEIAADYLPDKELNPSQVTWGWKEQQLGASRFAYMIFVYEGIADHRIGVTAQMAQQIEAETGKIVGGEMVIRLPPSSVTYFLPAIPGHRGADPTPTTQKSLCLSLMNEDVRFHLSGWGKEGGFVSHSLQLHDPVLLQMARAYGEELGIPHNRDAAQSLLYAMMSRFHRLLKERHLPLANSAFSPLDINQSAPADAREWELCRKVMDHIETRLSSPLNRANIARAMGVSPAHLGRVFHRVSGHTLMRYVTHRRLEAAKLVLINGPENIAEIAALSGFTSAASFCTMFRRANGFSPREYRRRHQ